MEQLIEFAGKHGMLVAAFGGVVLMLIWTEISRLKRGYVELTSIQAVQKINQGNTTIIDISAAAEFAKGHLTDSKNIALSRFSKADKDIEKAKSGPILVVCKNGHTAHQAAASLVKMGAADVAVLKGGITQWKSDQYPLVTK